MPCKNPSSQINSAKLSSPVKSSPLHRLLHTRCHQSDSCSVEKSLPFQPGSECQWFDQADVRYANGVQVSDLTQAMKEYDLVIRVVA